MTLLDQRSRQLNATLFIKHLTRAHFLVWPSSVQRELSCSPWRRHIRMISWMDIQPCLMTSMRDLPLEQFEILKAMYKTWQRSIRCCVRLCPSGVLAGSLEESSQDISVDSRCMCGSTALSFIFTTRFWSVLYPQFTKNSYTSISILFYETRVWVYLQKHEHYPMFFISFFVHVLVTFKCFICKCTIKKLLTSHFSYIQCLQSTDDLSLVVLPSFFFSSFFLMAHFRKFRLFTWESIEKNPK